MENGKKHEEEQDQQVDKSADTGYERNENEAEDDNQYSSDEGEDENGPKPSADEQE